MKSTDHFKKTISDHLNEMAVGDPLFAEKLKKEGKSIDDCITYILNTVKSSNCNGFSDDEIYGMAAHYYDEDEIDIGRAISGNVVINHKVELTEEEKAEVKEKAKEEFKDRQLKELRQSQERKEAREKKRLEKLKKEESDLRVKKAEEKEKIILAQPTLF